MHIPKEPFINCERLFFRNADAKSLINKINTEFSFTPQMVFFLKSIDRLMWKCICYTIFAARIYSNSSKGINSFRSNKPFCYSGNIFAIMVQTNPNVKIKTFCNYIPSPIFQQNYFWYFFNPAPPASQILSWILTHPNLPTGTPLLFCTLGVNPPFFL